VLWGDLDQMDQMHCIWGGVVSVLVNGEESNSFKIGKGLRQGDPLSPLLFNLVGDVLTKMLAKTAQRSLISKLLSVFREGGIIALHYADDTLLFFSCKDHHLSNLKRILILFEKVLGMRVNFYKSECIPLNIDEGRAHEITHVLGCPLGKLPFRYLGVPLHFEKLKREDLQPILDKLIKRIAGMRGRILAYSSRLVLIKICLASIPIYLLSFFKFPKWAIKLIESQIANCLWNDDNECHRYHLASWQDVNIEKEFGGLGVPNLRELNLCLLGSWVRMYFVDNEKI
jgi:hypothetical protein